ncbi:MAG: hypothetical protein LQ344_001395 [Seirophora lacunosa]|nr:MAG: hypothetical protein LQ344_001395 [Seirophora lacunosa]
MSSLSAGQPPNYIDPPSNAWKVSVVDSVGLCLTVLLFAIRCFTKYRITKSPGWEDASCLMALLGFIGLVCSNFNQRFRFGGGRQFVDVPPEMYNGFMRVSLSPAKTNTVKTAAITSYFYVLGIMFAKISLLLFLYRIFRVNFKFRIASWVIGVVLVVWSMVSFLLKIFSCHPVKANWDFLVYIDPKTHCYPKSYDVTNMQGFCNIITDFGLLLLPVPMLWRLQMNLKKKLGIAFVFSTGLSICVIAIVRQYILYNTDKAGDSSDATRIKIWMSLEFSLSIVVACLPVLTPFFKRYRVLVSFVPSSIRSRFSSRSTETQPAGKRSGGSETDVERDAVRNHSEKGVHSSWQVPRAWNERGLDDYDRMSEGSQITLQPVLPTRRELDHKD